MGGGYCTTAKDDCIGYMALLSAEEQNKAEGGWWGVIVRYPATFICSVNLHVKV